MVWALILVLVLFSSPAYAEEVADIPVDEEVNEVSETAQDEVKEIQEVAQKVSEVKQTVQTTSAAIVKSVEENTKAIGEMKADEPVEDNSGEILVTLEDISGKLDTIIIDGQESAPEPVQAVRANGTTFNAYGNVSTTGQFANYAAHLVPKVAWNHDYVFLQDSTSSYVFISGSCDFRTRGEFEFSDADYTRWYYAGTGTGYLVQSGHGDVVVHAGNYVVLSNLGSYPLLDDGVSLLRTEVAFYAVCAALLYVLGNIRAFLLRSTR